MIDKLVDKGILTVDEAHSLREEADKDFTRAYSVKTGMPDWVTTFRIDGDFRGRFDGLYGSHPGFSERARWRYRLRTGFTAVMLDDLEVGFRLGSGDLDNAASLTRGTDPISNNQSFQNNASKKGIFLHTAYARWSPINTGEWEGVFTLGKMENPITTSDLVFDNDYTPEGLGQQITYTLAEGKTLRFNAGQFVLDELGSSGADPYLLAQQIRANATWNSRWSSTLGAGFYGILNEDRLTSASVPDINTGNSRVVNVQRDASGRPVSYTLGAPSESFELIAVDLGVTYTLESMPLYSGAFPIRVYGDYLHNLGASEQGNGYQLGVTFGRAGRRGTWELTYRYKHLEGDAWWEELTDSNSGGFYEGPYNVATVPGTLRAPGTGYGAGTNIRGHWVRLGYSPFDSLTFNLTWIALDLIEEYAPGTPSDIDRLQIDAIWRF